MFAYLDCSSGVSGDMFLGALLDAGLPLDALRDRLAGLPIAGWSVSADEVSRSGLRATLVTVSDSGAEPARDFSDIETVIAGAELTDAARAGALRAFRLLAEAEARVHGVRVADVHFHEVGAVDSIIDMVGVAIGLAELGVDEMWASPVCVGSGSVETAHGVLPVPAPATAELLAGVPTFGGPVPAEMTTPTGAALLRAFVSRYAPAPPATAVAIGYGAGRRDPATPNVLRLTLCERGAWEGADEEVVLLETAIDHLSPEHLATALALVAEAGALDVWQTPIVMKKGRVGAAVTVMATPADAPRLAQELMRQTGSLGVRRTPVWRSVAERREQVASTGYGDVRVKHGGPPSAARTRPEADEVARIARETGEGVAEVARRLAGELEPGAGADAPHPDTE